MHIALIRCEARRSPFRFISVLGCVGYVGFGSLAVSRHFVRSILVSGRGHCPFSGWVVFCGCFGCHVKDL